MTAALLGRLRATAEAHEREEEKFRRDSQARLEALTAVRVAAYRRYHLLKGMVEIAAGFGTPEEATAAALDFALAETGWSEADSAYGEVRERLAETATATGLESDRAILALARFEAWYRERFGCDFLDLLERERAFLPVVDF